MTEQRDSVTAAELDELHKIKRGLEMSAEIMRDPHRTGRWEGAERVARSFERYATRVAKVHSTHAALRRERDEALAENDALHAAVVNHCNENETLIQHFAKKDAALREIAARRPKSHIHADAWAMADIAVVALAPAAQGETEPFHFYEATTDNPTLVRVDIPAPAPSAGETVTITRADLEQIFERIQPNGPGHLMSDRKLLDWVQGRVRALLAASPPPENSFRVLAVSDDGPRSLTLHFSREVSAADHAAVLQALTYAAAPASPSPAPAPSAGETRDNDLIRRGDVIAMLARLGDQHADLALYGAPENARNREAMEAACTRARCAVALMHAAPAPSVGETVPPERKLLDRIVRFYHAGIDDRTFTGCVGDVLKEYATLAPTPTTGEPT